MDHEEKGILESMLNAAEEAKDLPTLTKFANLPKKQLLVISAVRSVTTQHGETAVATIEPFSQPDDSPSQIYNTFLPGSVLRKAKIIGINRPLHLVVIGQIKTAAGFSCWDVRLRSVDE